MILKQDVYKTAVTVSKSSEVVSLIIHIVNKKLLAYKHMLPTNDRFPVVK